MRKNFRLLLIGFIALAVMSAFAIRFQSAAAQEETDQKQIAAPQADFIVNSTADPGDGVCNAAECTLREAIVAANGATGTDVILFAISGAGPFSIQPLTALPDITDTVEIDGYSQSGSTPLQTCAGFPTLQIAINGSLAAGTGANGLTLAAGSSTIRGLVVNGFDGNGVEILSGGNTIVGNFIGLDVVGTAAAPNGSNGINITSGDANQIGGVATTINGLTVNAFGGRNFISGNTGDGVSISGFVGSGGNLIQGNFIGTNRLGDVDLGNGGDGIDIVQSANNLIGGSSATSGCAPGNLISGNNEDGISVSGVSATGNTVQGNLIGINFLGNGDLGNASQGVYIFTSNNAIGGSLAATRNVISGNDGGGVNIGGGASNTVQGNYIGTNAAGTLSGAAFRNPDGVRIDTGANNNTIGGSSVAGTTAYVVTDNPNQLARFDLSSPFSVTPVGMITGLQSGETILGIDFRPATGQLYGLGSTSRLYIIDTTTAAARQVGTGQFSTLLNGTAFGFDFNPTADHIRVVSDTGQNLRLNPNTGVVAAVDGNLNGAATAADAVAYTSNDNDPSTGTTLFDIDSTTDTLYRQDPPNSGTLVSIGSLGVNTTSATGFDINTVGGTDTAYAALRVGAGLNLYTINLATGAAAPVSFIGGSSDLRGFAVEPAADAPANIISGNDVGVHIAGGDNNTVRGNLIGTAADGTTDVGNLEAGVYIHDVEAVGNLIGGVNTGEGNTIRFNGDGTLINTLAGEGGIVIYFGATGNPILRNSITENTGLGIDLDSSATPTIGADGVTPNDPNDVDSGDANNLQNYPVLAMASTNTMTTVTGTLNSTPSRTFRVEFFSDTAADPSGNGEGRTFVGAQNVTTNASGNAVINFTTTTPVPNGNTVSATATDLTTFDTSEFSRAVTASSGGGGFEADISPRPNGDNLVQSDDVVQIRRFLNGTDTPSTTPNEFQRADSSPYASKGDGAIDTTDVVQTRRYQNGSDLPQTAGGPTQPGGTTTTLTNGFNKTTAQLQSPEGNPREVRVESASGSAGQMVTVNIRVNAVGNESEYGFIINYDTSVLSNPVIGAGNAGASVRSCNIATAGTINCSVGGFPNNQMGSSDAGIGEIAAGNNQILITVTFTIAANATPGTTPLTLSNVNASSDAPQLFTPTATNGTVTILAPTAANVSLSGRVSNGQGKGVMKAQLTMTNSQGEKFYARSNSFGYFRFTEVEAGETYIITVKSKQYTFAPQVVNAGQDVTDIIFIAEPEQ